MAAGGGPSSAGKGCHWSEVIRDTVATQECAEKKVLVRTQDLENLNGSRRQTLLARNADFADLNVKLAAAQKRVVDVEFERDGA